MATRLIAVLVVVSGVVAAAAVGGALEGTRTAAPPEPKAQPPFAREPAPEAEGRLVTPEEALRMDAREVARMYGISEEEALRRFELVDVVTAFKHRVQAREKPRFGGMYIQNEPDYGVVVLLTSGDISDIENIVPDRLRGLVVVRRVERTLEELHAMQERTSRLRSVMSFDSSTNLHLNRVELYLVASTRSELESATRTIRDAAAQSGEPLPDWVAIVGSVEPVDPTPGEWSDELLRRSPVGGTSEMDALLSGTLHLDLDLDLDLDRGCVLLSGHAVVWPAGTTFTRDPPQLHLAGGLTAKQGDTVRGGGGALPGAVVRETSEGIEGDLDKALACATAPEVYVFVRRGQSMDVSPGG